MPDTVRSKNGALIRLTDERWEHITEEHSELAGLRLELSGGQHLVVVYRELQSDGFVITAFLTSKTRSLNRRTQVWPG